MYVTARGRWLAVLGWRHKRPPQEHLKMAGVESGYGKRRRREKDGREGEGRGGREFATDEAAAR